MSTITDETQAVEESATPTPSEAEEQAERDESLFNPAVYDNPELKLPHVDGEQIQKIAIKFSGTVFLDRSDPRDVELMRKMRLGQDLTLMVEGKCSKKGHGYTTDREGELDVVKLEHAISVHTVYKPASE